MAKVPKHISAAEVEMISDQIPIRKIGNKRCENPHLGSVVGKLLVPSKRAMTEHLRARFSKPSFDFLHAFRPIARPTDVLVKWPPP